MRTAFSAMAALAVAVSAQSTTFINIAAISVAVPTSVFVLPVVYVTENGAAAATATVLASTAIASSDPKATDVFDSAADVKVAISSASELAAATASPISRVKRDLCVQQPLGISYGSLPDTAAAFAADAYYGAQAIAAGVPTGFIQTMSNMTASNSADQYMGFTLLPTYDVATCVNKCSAIDGCNSVNIYFERDPTVNPDSSACLNPPSTVNIKCVFWGGAVVAANANNFGQWRDNFQVLVAGSNGYMKSTFAAKLAAKASATSSSSTAAASATNAAGNIYTLYYSSDSTTGAYSNAQASSSYQDCMTACDADSQCNAFTYVGGANGVGSGTCWLKASLGSPSSSGNNVVSGTRSGKASSSVSSTVSSTTSSSSSSTSSASFFSSFSTVSKTSSSSLVSSTASSTTASLSIASSSTSSSASSSSSSTVSKTSSSSVVSSTSSSTTASSTTASSTTSSTVTPTTMATSTKSSTSSSSSSTTSSSSSTISTTSTTSTAPTALSTGFYIVPAQNYYMHVASGTNAKVGYSAQSAATRFEIDTTTGYLLTTTGSNVGYVASMPQGANLNQPLVFNPTGSTAANYVKCALNENAGWLECTSGGVFQQAYACQADSYSTLYIGPNIPSGCNWIGLYRVTA